MRRLPLAIAVLLAVGYGAPQPLAGQFPQLPGAVRGLADRIPDLGRFTGQGPVLTTSLQDVVGRRGPLPGGLADGSFAALASLPRGSNGEVQLRAGRFAMTVESYCLHPGGKAGAHADGFFLAPLRGPWAPIIAGIMRSASRFPALKQETIQLLLWGVIARTPISSMPREVQAAAALLVAPQDLIKVNGGALGLVPQQLLDLAQERLPEGIREAFEAESRIRQMIADGVSTYEEFESIAVPDADEARQNSDGSGDDEWVLHPRGFYIRFSPNGYQQVRIEIVVPPRPGVAILNQPTGRFRILSAAWHPAAGVQAGDAGQTVDLPGIAAIPGDSGGQRLGLSNRLVPGTDPITPAGPLTTRNNPPDDLGPQPPIALLDPTTGGTPTPAPTRTPPPTTGATPTPAPTPPPTTGGTPAPAPTPPPTTGATPTPAPTVAVRTGELSATGYRFEPVAVRTDELSATGYRFEPVTVRTGELSATGYRFEPVAVRTDELSATGYRFEPVKVRTDELSATGFRPEPTVDKPALSKGAP